MVRHTAVVYRSEWPGSATFITFDGERWADYVPIRIPGTISVKKNLPPGAAAVLINPTHTYTDLYLPISTQEVRLVETIDGTRTIGAIAQASGRLEATRDLFQRLWWYDQVVFDASAGESQTPA
jgi:hypothetical protein